MSIAEPLILAPPAVEVEPAAPADASGIAALLRRCAPETVVVPERDVLRNIRRYVVVRDEEGGVVASAAVHPVSSGASELRSLAVDPRCRGAGFGPALVRRIARVMQRRGHRLLCVTLRPRFFARFGFRRIPLDRLPRKEDRPAFVNGRPRIAMIRPPDAAPLAAEGLA